MRRSAAAITGSMAAVHRGGRQPSHCGGARAPPGAARTGRPPAARSPSQGVAPPAGPSRARTARLGKQFTFMQAHPEIGLLGTFAERIDAAGNVVGRLAPPTDPARLARVLARTNPFVHSSVMMRTALVRRSGGYRAAFRAAEDYDLWLRMAEAGGIAKLADYFTHYPRPSFHLSRGDAGR